MKKFLLLFVAFPFLLYAQNTEEEEATTDDIIDRQFWQATVPGGNYIVALDAITSVSSHAYILDGVAVITEVNIDTDGNSLVRFYTITPLVAYENADIQDLFSEGIDSLKEVTSSISEGESLKLTHKTTNTTHAKTVEYQIDTLPNLKKLFRSIQRSYLDSQGRSFTLK